MKQEQEKPELTDLQKADCLTGKALGGIAFRAPGWGAGKRRRFVFEDRDCFYHTMSRVAGGELLFGDIEKEAFRKLMRRMERFSGVEVLTYAVMGNHFHLLLRVPERAGFLAKFTKKGSREEREERLMDHLKSLYSKGYLKQLEEELTVMKEKKMDELYEKTIHSYLDRLCSLKHFMKELKERFSRWFNKRHGRRGTLWQDRYRSILVEDGEALQTMGAYIDLNPVRAGLANDPKDYRWCGMAEALGGSKRARRAVCVILGMPVSKWDSVGREAYRRLVLGEGIEAGAKVQAEEKRRGRKDRKRGITREKALEELRAGGKLSRVDLLKCRVRYFSEGLVLGSRSFVEARYQEKREWFGKKRKVSPKGVPVKDESLFSLRNLKKPLS